MKHFKSHKKINSTNNKYCSEVKINGEISCKERNLIKKVKTYCVKCFTTLIKTCINNQNCFSFYNMKNKVKRKLFRNFKSDISKVRNFTLMNIPLKLIFENLTNISWAKLDIKIEKQFTFNYLINMTWNDLLIALKRRSPFLEQTYDTKITSEDIKNYIKYVENTDYNYNKRVNVDKSYLQIYEKIFDKIACNNQNQSEATMNYTA